MPAAKRAVTINLGMQTVTMAVFEVSGGSGIALTGLARADLLPDPAADASRPGQLKIALGELKTRLKPGTSFCAVAVPSQGVFTRFVRIPKVESAQVGQMLFFEAQQNVPYPIEEVSWCYQVLPEAEEDKLGAVILATKLDQLEATVGAVQGAGYAPAFIETSPTALYNALRYNYPDLVGCALLVDIGARATNLIFVEGERLFVRTLPVGGNSITAALQKRFENRSLTAVEEAKVAEAFIPPPGNHQHHGADAEEMGKIARTVMTRIHNEITRSITFYRTNQQGSAPTRVFLAGGGVSMAYTLEFFNEKLSLPIEFFNPLRRVTVAPSADPGTVSRCAHSLGECVGLATRALLGDCPLEVNLESRRLGQAVRDKKRQPYLLAAVVMLAALLGLVFAHYNRAAGRLTELNASLDGEIGKLDTFKQQLDKAEADRKKLLADSADVAAAPLLRTAWSTVIDELSERMPAKNIWITRLRPMAGDAALAPASGGATWTAAGSAPSDDAAPASTAASGADTARPAVTALAIDGLYLENEGGPAIVDQFVESLSQSAVFAVPTEKKNEIVKLRSAQTGENWAYEYQLILPLRRPIPL